MSLVALFAGAVLVAPEVVELHDGSRLVGELRSSKEGVVLTSPLGRLEIGHDQIARLERRNDLLTRHRLAQAAAGTQPHALLSLASFDLDRGLYPEAFDAADAARAAGADPALIEALQQRLAADALLDGAAPALPPTDDATRRKLLVRLIGSSESRAAFARPLLLAGEPQATQAFLLDRLANGPASERRAAAHLLGEQLSDRALGKLVRASLIDSDDQVRGAAREAALRSRHPELAVPYLKALETDDSRFRERAYPALAELRDPRAVDGLIAMLEPRAAPGSGAGSSPPHANVYFGEQRAFVRDFDVEIAQGAVIAKPVIGVLQSGVVLDVAVAGVFVIRAEERRAALGALKKLTGQSFGADAATWHAWWKQQGGTLPSVAAATN